MPAGAKVCNPPRVTDPGRARGRGQGQGIPSALGLRPGAQHSGPFAATTPPLSPSRPAPSSPDAFGGSEQRCREHPRCLPGGQGAGRRWMSHLGMTPVFWKSYSGRSYTMTHLANGIGGTHRSSPHGGPCSLFPRRRGQGRSCSGGGGAVDWAGSGGRRAETGTWGPRGGRTGWEAACSLSRVGAASPRPGGAHTALRPRAPLPWPLPTAGTKGSWPVLSL